MKDMNTTRDGRFKTEEEDTSRTSQARAKITSRMVAIDNLGELEDYDARKAIWTNTKPFLESLGETLEDDDIRQDFWAHRPIHGSKRKRDDSVHENSKETPIFIDDAEKGSDIEEEGPILDSEKSVTAAEKGSSRQPRNSTPERSNPSLPNVFSLNRQREKADSSDTSRAVTEEADADVEMSPRADRSMLLSEGEESYVEDSDGKDSDGKDSDEEDSDEEDSDEEDSDEKDSDEDDGEEEEEELGDTPSPPSLINQPPSKRLKIVHSHIAEHEVNIPSPYPKVLDQLMAEHTANTQILTKMRKYDYETLAQEHSQIDPARWPESFHFPRLISIEEVISGPIPTKDQLINKIAVVEGGSDRFEASCSSNPKPGHGNKSMGHKVKTTEWTLEWPQSLLGEQSVPNSRRDNKLTNQTVDIFHENALSGWRLEAGKSTICAVTAGTIWFFAPLTNYNRILFQDYAHRGDTSAFCRFVEQSEMTIMVTQKPSHAMLIPTGTLHCAFALNSYISYGIRCYFAHHINRHARALTALWPSLNDGKKDLYAKRYLKILRVALKNKATICSAIDGICDGQFVMLVQKEKQRFGPAHLLFKERFNVPEGLWEFNKECPCGQEMRNQSKSIEKTIKHIQVVHIESLTDSYDQHIGL